MSGPPERRRVTAPRPRRAASAVQARTAERDHGDADVIFRLTLVRAQLRLALAFALGFIATIATAAVMIATIPFLQHTVAFGVPVSWLLQAYGYYPVIAVFAAFYVWAAARNEGRYRSLADRG